MSAVGVAESVLISGREKKTKEERILNMSDKKSKDSEKYAIQKALRYPSEKESPKVCATSFDVQKPETKEEILQDLAILSNRARKLHLEIQELIKVIEKKNFKIETDLKA